MPCRSYSTGQADPAVALLSPLSVEEVVGEEVEMVAATTMGVATFHALPRAGHGAHAGHHGPDLQWPRPRR